MLRGAERARKNWPGAGTGSDGSPRVSVCGDHCAGPWTTGQRPGRLIGGEGDWYTCCAVQTRSGVVRRSVGGQPTLLLSPRCSGDGRYGLGRQGSGGAGKEVTTRWETSFGPLGVHPGSARVRTGGPGTAIGHRPGRGRPGRRSRPGGDRRGHPGRLRRARHPRSHARAALHPGGVESRGRASAADAPALHPSRGRDGHHPYDDGEQRRTSRHGSGGIGRPDGFVLEGDDLPEGGRRFSYAEVERARTVFEWGGQPRPSDGRRHGSAQHRAVRSPLGADREKVTTS
jgi:hypothetical protein